MSPYSPHPHAILVASLVAIALLLPQLMEANQPFFIPAFVYTDEVEIEIMIGAAIDATDHDRDGLFSGEPSRESHFVTQLEADVTETLLEYGVLVTDDANAGAMVGIWGHAVPGSDCDIDWVFYVKLDLWECVDDDDDCLPSAGGGKIGAVSDRELEATISKVVLDGLDSALQYRERVREHFQEGPPE